MPVVRSEECRAIAAPKRHVHGVHVEQLEYVLRDAFLVGLVVQKNLHSACCTTPETEKNTPVHESPSLPMSLERISEYYQMRPGSNPPASCFARATENLSAKHPVVGTVDLNFAKKCRNEEVT